MRKCARTVALLALLVGVPAALAPSPVSGQDAVVRSGERGWVGISYDLQGAPNGSVHVVVTQVVAGSPAQGAGVLVGDRLISINGHPARSNFDNVPLDIRAGEAVSLVVTRGDEPVTISLVAALRPTDVPRQSSVTVTLAADSMAESWFRAMDSLRVTLLTADGDSLATDRVDAAGVRVAPRYEFRIRSDTVDRGAVTWSSPRGSLVVVDEEDPGVFTLEEVQAPFGFWVFRTEAHDSLRQAMDEFNQEFRALRLREAERLRPFTDGAGRLRVHVEDHDQGLGDLPAVLKEYAERSAVLQRAVDRAAQEAARPRVGYVVARADAPEVRPGAEASPSEFFGPLSPYALGQDRVAGAQVVDLQPELAAYFQVERGVLVVDVLSGTPMALGGVEPGDVITRLHQVSIGSVQDLRLALGRMTEEAPLSVVRKGRRLQVLLPR